LKKGDLVVRRSSPGAMRYELGVLVEYLKLNSRTWASHRSDLVLATLSSFFALFTWGLVAIFLPGSRFDEAVKATSRNPVDFILLGQLGGILLRWPSRRVSSLLGNRGFVGIWMTPARFVTSVLGFNSFGYVWSLMTAGVFVLGGILFFHLTINIGWALVLVVIGSLITMYAFELIAAGIFAFTKTEEDPIMLVIGLTGMLVAGVYFPPELLPDVLKPLAAVHPHRYILSLLRRTVSLGQPLSEVGPDILGMFGLGIPFFIFACFVFKWGFNRARREGTLGHV